jgi:hypothetical protein
VSLAVARGADHRFLDAIALDFREPEGGLCGLALIELHPEAERSIAAGVLLDGEEVVAASGTDRELRPPGDWTSVSLDGIRIGHDGARASAAFEANEAGFEISSTLLDRSSVGQGDAFGELAGIEQELAATRAVVEVRQGGSSTRIECPGRAIRTRGAPDWRRIELLRTLSAVLADGSLLALGAVRPRSAPGHGEEELSGSLVGAEESVRFDEPLLSTEYDATGHQRRATLELYAEGAELPLRGAGRRIAGVSLPLGDARLEVAFLDLVLAGERGTARYDILRAP